MPLILQGQARTRDVLRWQRLFWHLWFLGHHQKIVAIFCNEFFWFNSKAAVEEPPASRHETLTWIFFCSRERERGREREGNPPLKAFVDRNRKRYGKASINYPQPMEQQKQKMEQYDAHRETLFAAKGKADDEHYKENNTANETTDENEKATKNENENEPGRERGK